VDVKIEVCVEDAHGLEVAVAAGADRIELCSSLGEGGLTPSYGLMVLAASKPVPSHALIRPRAGDFHFSPTEVQVMVRDIEAAKQAGLAGVVIGASRPDCSLDAELLAHLINHARPLEATLHRAFDLTPDPLAALEQAIELGFKRILTSGGAGRAIEALPLLAQLQAQAAGRIVIMPGSGIDASNVAQIIADTKVQEVHASCREAVAPTNTKIRSLGFEALQPMRTSASKIRELRGA